MTPENDIFGCANKVKASFDGIYDAPDPRAYYTTLSALDYQIPTNAKPVFQKVIQAMDQGGKPKILDVGCSYGVNAAMLQFDTTFEELARHYASERCKELSVAETVVRDAEMYRDWRKDNDAQFIGLDVAKEAAGYADAVGLLDDAVVANLESEPVSEEAVNAFHDTDLVITTGAVGYVGEETFGKLAEVADSPPWFAAFVLRQFPFDEIAGRLAEFGLTTEKLSDATFLQRRFLNQEEQDGAIEAVRAAGCDPEGYETDGYYHAEFFLARPIGCNPIPIKDLI